MVLTAINIQRAVGGNLAEILDKVAFTMRERERIRGEIATLTSPAADDRYRHRRACRCSCSRSSWS